MRDYAAPLKEARVDTVILGCTHYPLIRPIFQRLRTRRDAGLLRRGDSTRSCGDACAQGLRERAPNREGEYRFLTTGDPAAFRDMGVRFLQLPIADVEHVEVTTLAAA